MGIVLSEDRRLYGPMLGHPMDPRTDVELDDDAMTEDDARELAEEEFRSTPANFADWLSKVCDTDEGWKPTKVEPIGLTTDLIGLTTAQLVAMWVAGNDMQAKRVRHVIRERYLQAERAEIARRADEIYREHNPELSEEA